MIDKSKLGLIALVAVVYTFTLFGYISSEIKNKDLSDKYDFIIEENLRLRLLNSTETIGNYREGIICLEVVGKTWSRVMETCSHEYLHYKFSGHFKKESEAE